MNFDPVVEAQLNNATLRLGVLVEFLFATTTIRLWNGAGQLPTLDGKTWEGLSGIGSIEGLDQAVDGVAPTQTFTVSGVDDRFAALARGDRDEYYRRSVITYLQFFGENWQPLVEPFALTLRAMDTIKAMRQAVDGEVTYTVSLTAETPFTTRRRPPFSYFTDRDQKRRFPGDRGLERVAGINDKPITFPDY